jgi:hypothetical protein
MDRRDQVRQNYAKGPSSTGEFAKDQRHLGSRPCVVPEVSSGGIYGSWIKIHGKGFETTKGRCGQGEHSAAASCVQDPPFHHIQGTVLASHQFVQELQCQTGTRMVPVAKGLLWIDKEYCLVLRGPPTLTRWAYEETGRDLPRLELLSPSASGVLSFKNVEFYGKRVSKCDQCRYPWSQLR